MTIITIISRVWVWAGSCMFYWQVTKGRRPGRVVEMVKELLIIILKISSVSLKQQLWSKAREDTNHLSLNIRLCKIQPTLFPKLELLLQLYQYLTILLTYLEKSFILETEEKVCLDQLEIEEKLRMTYFSLKCNFRCKLSLKNDTKV